MTSLLYIQNIKQVRTCLGQLRVDVERLEHVLGRLEAVWEPCEDSLHILEPMPCKRRYDCEGALRKSVVINLDVGTLGTCIDVVDASVWEEDFSMNQADMCVCRGGDGELRHAHNVRSKVKDIVTVGQLHEANCRESPLNHRLWDG